MMLKKVSYGDWPDCLELNNGTAKLVITLDVGPRILYYGFCFSQNMFKNYEEQLGLSGGDRWMIYGGHRLWAAPEVFPDTYYPDNQPVAYAFDGKTLVLDCLEEENNKIRKSIEIELAPSGTQVTLRHKIHNTGNRTRNFSCWSLSVMAPGGTAIIPQEKFMPHGTDPGETVLPGRTLAIWPFTDMSDSRLTWGKEFIRIKEGGEAGKIVKIGLANRRGWMAYMLDRDLFVKRNEYMENAGYPDMGCNQEVYTENGMLELEALSPLGAIAPGCFNELAESWELHRVESATGDGAQEDLLACLDR